VNDPEEYASRGSAPNIALCRGCCSFTSLGLGLPAFDHGGRRWAL
jgi:hypothetical protein